MAKYSARRAFFWQLIAKNRKRRLALHTAESEYRVSEKTAIAPSGMLDRAFVSEQQWSSGLATASNAMLIYGPLTARNSLKSSGYLDLHLSFYWIAFVTPLKKTPSLKSLVSTCSQFPEAKLSRYSACSSGGK